VLGEQEPVHLIARTDHGVGIYSPQLPGVTGAYPDAKSMATDFRTLLDYAGVTLAGRELIAHSECVRHDGDVLIRVAKDAHRGDRAQVAERLTAALAGETQYEDIMDAPRARTGAALFICAVPSDTIGWITDQLDPRGETAAAVVGVGDEAIYVAYFARGLEEVTGWHDLSHWGWTRDTTLSEAMRAQPIRSRPRRVLVSAA
jgi:hypothetical protein